MIRVKARGQQELQLIIEDAYAQSANKAGDLLPEPIKQAIDEVVGLVNRGHLRAAKFVDGQWVTQTWVKQAILLYFKTHYSEDITLEPFQWVDKIAIKKWTMDMGVRVVPPAVVRYGAYVGKNCVLMPSYINIGAFVDEGTMVDTWATVGSCAQIGKNVHLSGGVGIGGVLEPLQAAPVIIEDECFVGSRVIVVEGVLVKTRAVLGAGVVLTASTPIVDVRGTDPVVTKGVIPENAVVIPGSVTKKFPAGKFNVPCALIIGDRSPSTDLKTSLTQALRDFEVPV